MSWGTRGGNLGKVGILVEGTGTVGWQGRRGD